MSYNQNQKQYEPWKHLFDDGMAEEIPAETKEIMFRGMFAKFREILPSMSDELEQAIRNRCKVIRFKKNAVMLRYDEVCDYCFFSTAGLVTALRQTEKNKERNCWFMMGGDVIIGVKSFYDRVPSAERLVALDDTDCIALHVDDLQWVYDTYVEFNIVGRILTQKYYVPAMERTNWVGLNAEKRFELVYDEYPKFITMVPDSALASYLGITDRTLRRVKTIVYKRKGLK